MGGQGGPHPARGDGKTRAPSGHPTTTTTVFVRRVGCPARPNFCARSVVSCDSHLSAAEVMVPRSIIHRLTVPVVVHPYNRAWLLRCLQQGQITFIQRAGTARMRSINHLAIQNLSLGDGDCILRRGNKYVLHTTNATATTPPPPLLSEDIPLPVQNPADEAVGSSGVVLCFGDRVLDRAAGRWLDPLTCISWPDLRVGDSVLLVPQEGMHVLMNRQPTLVRSRRSSLGLLFIFLVDRRGIPGVHAGHAPAHRATTLVRRKLRPGRGAAR